jgi:agmatine deiminase
MSALPPVVWFSSLFKERFEVTVSEIERILTGQKIIFNFLKETNDIWCRDYLPVYDGNGGYVQFKFDPGYLKYEKYRHLVTNPYPLHKQLNITPAISILVIDGGNIVRLGKTIVITDAVKKDNPAWSEEEIVNELCNKLNTSKVVIIPRQPNDFTSHADGMVRLLDESFILVNDFSREGDKFKSKLKKSLDKAGLKPVAFPYAMDYASKSTSSAVGTYMNFLMIGNTILLPEFNLDEDDLAESEIRNHYPHHDVFRIDCRSLALDGGVLNCVGWVADAQITNYSTANDARSSNDNRMTRIK